MFLQGLQDYHSSKCGDVANIKKVLWVNSTKLVQKKTKIDRERL